MQKETKKVTGKEEEEEDVLLCRGESLERESRRVSSAQKRHHSRRAPGVCGNIGRSRHPRPRELAGTVD